VLLPSIDALGSLQGKAVLVRVDFNCPLREVDGKREVVDDFRIRAALPLFRELQRRGAKVTACTHLGRPNGEPVERYSVAPVRVRLNELISDVELLENLRFHPGEEGNDPEFGRKLIQGFDAYVNEAFGASHRAHASIVFPPTQIPSAAGPNLQNEVHTLLGALAEPQRPFVAIVGGAKVADKLGITKVLAERADYVIVGGGMAFTFWHAMGRGIGDSLFDASRVDDVAALLSTGRIVLPSDVWTLPTGTPFGAGGEVEPVLRESSIPDGEMGLDVGPESVRRFQEVIAEAATILWNGPMGVFEDPRLDRGTRGVAEAMAASRGATIVGGGDSAAAVDVFGVADKMKFISTGGGASLELLEFGDLPGLRALRGNS